MTLSIKLYITSYLILTITCLILLILKRKEIILFKKDYFSFLLQKWKIITFLIATISLSYISTLGYDPTWDIPETIIMSILTFYFSPYSVGVIYRHFKGINKSLTELYIGVILILFSSCWFYDIYAMIFLLGYYPETAFVNISLSPYFYLFAGIMWNLDYSKKDGVIFVFTKKEWINYKGEKGGLLKIFSYILPFIMFMIIVFGYFIYLNL